MAKPHRRKPESAPARPTRGSRGAGKPRHVKPERESTGGGEEHLYGVNPVEAALRAGRRRLGALLLRRGQMSARVEALRDLAVERGVRVTELEPADLERRCASSHHQGVGLACGPLPVLGERECLGAAPGERALLLALDEVQDPRNLGAVVRSAAVFGIDGVVVPRHHGAALSPVVSRASAGYLETFPLYVVANLARFLETARKRGFWIAGTGEEGATPLHGFSRDRALVVVLGNEGRGLRPLVRKQCDFELSIRTAAGGSLNVSTAAAVVLYQLTLPEKPEPPAGA